MCCNVRKMALFKKILPSSVTRKKSRDSVLSMNSEVPVSGSASKASSCESSPSDIIDIFLMDVKYKDKRDGLNFHFSRHRRRDRKLSRLKQGLLEMENEMKELQRMISKTEAEIRAVVKETKERLEELEKKLNLVDKDTEVEVKKKEPLLFKKYSNLKSASECQHLIKSVRQKQRALLHIELLIYRKYLKFQHGGPSKPDRCRGKFHSLLPVKPTKFKDCRMFTAYKDQPEGVVFVEIEDQQDNDVIDLTGDDDTAVSSPFDVPGETEV